MYHQCLLYYSCILLLNPLRLLHLDYPLTLVMITGTLCENIADWGYERVYTTYIHIYTHTYIIHTYVRTYIHIHIHTNVHKYNTHIHTYIHIYIQTYIYTRTYIHTYIHTHTDTYIQHIHRHTHICTQVRTYVHIHTHIHTNIHTHIYTDIIPRIQVYAKWKYDVEWVIKMLNIGKYYDKNIIIHRVHSIVTFNPLNLSHFKKYNFTNRVTGCTCD
jgi:hypothetical protein